MVMKLVNVLMRRIVMKILMLTGKCIGKDDNPGAIFL